MAMAIKSLISLIKPKSKSFFPLPRHDLSFVSPIRFQSTAKADPNSNYCFTYTDKDFESEESLKALFDCWLSHYGYSFPTATEHDHRFNVFKNARYAQEFNKQGHSCTLGLTYFAATTDEEMTTYYIGPILERE